MTEIVFSLLAGFLPMFFFALLVYWFDVYEKEPLLLLGGVFFWGAFVAAGAAFLLNTGLGVGISIFSGSEMATEWATSALIAPVLEETLKGAAVLLVFFIRRNDFDSYLDGVVYAAIAALGFAATENAYYIYQYGFVENGWIGFIALFFVRVILVGWQHPFYTSFTGIGLSYARFQKPGLLRFLAPLCGWLMAVFTHTLHNSILLVLVSAESAWLGTLIDWFLWTLMGLFLVYILRDEKKKIARNLAEEVEINTITAAQQRVITSIWKQNAASLRALGHGKYKMTRRFFHLCAELSLKKYLWQRLGEEAHLIAIGTFREEIQRLSLQVGF